MITIECESFIKKFLKRHLFVDYISTEHVFATRDCCYSRCEKNSCSCVNILAKMSSKPQQKRRCLKQRNSEKLGKVNRKTPVSESSFS